MTLRPWLSEAEAGDLSNELRRGTGSSLTRRRRIVAGSLAASGALGLVALYQTGIVRRLPEPPIRGFDGERVDRSPEAYRLLSMPDAVLGIASYAATTALAAAGGADRTRRHPVLGVALGAKALADGAAAAKLTADQFLRHRAACFWCLVAAAASFAVLPPALIEARDALRQLSR